MLTTVKQINDKEKSSLYILYIQDTIVATTHKMDMDKFLQGDANVVSIYDEDIEQVILIHGLVLSNTELPFGIYRDIMKGRQLWLFVNEFDGSTVMDPYPTIHTVTQAIEGYLEDQEELEISDFAIVLGEEITLGLMVSKAGDQLQTAKVYE